MSGRLNLNEVRSACDRAWRICGALHGSDEVLDKAPYSNYLRHSGGSSLNSEFVQ